MPINIRPPASQKPPRMNPKVCAEEQLLGTFLHDPGVPAAVNR